MNFKAIIDCFERNYEQSFAFGSNAQNCFKIRLFTQSLKNGAGGTKRRAEKRVEDENCLAPKFDKTDLKRDSE